MFTFRLPVLALVVAYVAGFAPSRFSSRARSEIQMSAEQPTVSKMFGAAVLAAAMFASPVVAAEGAGAKQNFFGDATSSPFVINENREVRVHIEKSTCGQSR